MLRENNRFFPSKCFKTIHSTWVIFTETFWGVIDDSYLTFSSATHSEVEPICLWDDDTSLTEETDRPFVLSRSDEAGLVRFSIAFCEFAPGRFVWGKRRVTSHSAVCSYPQSMLSYSDALDFMHTFLSEQQKEFFALGDFHLFNLTPTP